MTKFRSILSQAIKPAGALALAATLAFGQGQASKGTVIKGKAPVNKDVLKVSLPKPYETKLANGLQVVILENHKLPTVSMQMVVLSGGLADAANQEGVAQYTATMLREGTKTRSSKQIADQIAALGASLSAGASLSSVTSAVSASGLSDNFDQITNLFADVVLNPSFPADEFNKVKSRAAAQLRLSRSNPAFLAGERFSKAIYGEHPGGRFSLTPEQLQRLTPEMLKQFHAANYRPNNAIIAIVGDVKPADAVKKIEQAFGSWEKSNVTATSIPAVSQPGASRIYLIDRPGSVQTNLVLGNLTIDRTDPDYFAVTVMNRVFGGGPSARLFLNLREDKGYTYGAYSNTSASKFRGTLQANTEVRTDVTEGSMKELYYEIKRIRDEKVPTDELDNAKRSIVGSFARQLETPAASLDNIVTAKIYGLPADYWETYPAHIAAVTAEDVQRVAQKYLDLGTLQVIAVGDAGKITDVLKKYGTVEVYDTDGRPAKLGAAAPSTGASGATSLAGLWNLMVKTPDGNELPLKATIKLDGGNVTGSIESPLGPSQIVSGQAKGEDVTFKIKADVQGQPMELNFAGKQTGSTLKGSISSSTLPPLEVNGTKQE